MTLTSTSTLQHCLPPTFSLVLAPFDRSWERFSNVKGSCDSVRPTWTAQAALPIQAVLPHLQHPLCLPRFQN
jgi:hypothetical protein